MQLFASCFSVSRASYSCICPELPGLLRMALSKVCIIWDRFLEVSSSFHELYKKLTDKTLERGAAAVVG